MHLRRHSLRIVALAVVIALPLLGTSAVASAKAKAAGCHKTHTCKSAGGGSTASGAGADPAPITVQVDPNPLVETGESFVLATIQVETSPAFAGDAVNIDSSQLAAVCDGGMGFADLQNGGTPADPNISTPNADSFSAILDDDGNATVGVDGFDCAPGPSVIEADLEVAPYYTALTTLVASPPVVTTPGVTGYPTTSGTVTTGEVETGDTLASGDSDVYAVFYVETSPVYAEQPVEISSDQLDSRCGTGWSWGSFYDEVSNESVPYSPVQAILDDDGNAVIFFFGSSCAAGSSQVIADVEAGTHPTYTTTFNIVAPQPTI